MTASIPTGLIEQMLEGVGHPVLAFDHRWVVIAANSAATTRFGTCRTVVTLLHPDDLSALHALCRPHGTATQTLRMVDVEGAVWPASVTVTALGPDDHIPTSWVAWIQDLREEAALHENLMKVERRARDVFDALPIGVAVVDSDDVILDANPSLAGLLTGREADLVGRSLRALWTPAEDPGGTTVPDQRVRGRTNEHDRWVQVTTSGTTIGPEGHRLVAVEDIDELTVREDEEAIRQRLAAIGRLAAGVAHEINTPLQYVGDNLRYAIDAVDRLTESLDPDSGGAAVLTEVPDALADAQEGLQRVQDLAAAMKVLAHPGGVWVEDVDLVAVVRQAVTVCAGETRRTASVQVRADRGPVPTTCRPTQIGEVVVNLIVNAAQAIREAGRDEPGSIVVHVSTEGPESVISVADDGPGIPHEVQTHIFEPYFTTKEVGRGSGWGLARAHRIVVGEHGGTLTCLSRPGRGATFTLRLQSQRGDATDDR